MINWLMWSDPPNNQDAGSNIGSVTQGNNSLRNARYLDVAIKRRMELMSGSNICIRTSSYRHVTLAMLVRSIDMMDHQQTGHQPKQMPWWLGWSHMTTPMNDCWFITYSSLPKLNLIHKIYLCILYFIFSKQKEKLWSIRIDSYLFSFPKTNPLIVLLHRLFRP